MSRLWSTLGLAALLAGLAAYIYFIESERDLSPTEPRESVFADLDADDIEELFVRGTEGEAARLAKTDAGWRLVEPVEAGADEDEATSVASGLASLAVDRVVDDAPADLSVYGLDPPRMEVAFRTSDDTELRRVLIGDTTPTGGNLYAALDGEPRVFLIASYLDSTFDKNAFTLRDRRILVFDRDAVDRLEVEDGGETITLEKEGSEWTLTSPVEARADFAAVEGALGRLSSTRMQGVVEADAADVSPYGLDSPTGAITVGTGSSEATLTLGSTENALLFARDSSRPMVFTVAPAIRDDVIRSVDDFRRKDLFDGRGFTATRVEFRRGEETLVFEKREDDDGAATWTRADGAEVDSTAVDGLLTSVTGLRATSFEAGRHRSLEAPVLVVTLEFDGDRSETVTFGSEGEEAYASRADEPGAAVIDASGLTDLLGSLDEVS